MCLDVYLYICKYVEYVFELYKVGDKGNFWEGRGIQLELRIFCCIYIIRIFYNRDGLYKYIIWIVYYLYSLKIDNLYIQK